MMSLDRVNQSNYYSEVNKKIVEQDSITKKFEKTGVRPGNDTSESNQFNTMSPDAYDKWKAYNAGLRVDEYLRTKGSTKAGNLTSDDNPMRIDPLTLNSHRYGEFQPKFNPPYRRDAGRDRDTMEDRTRGMYEQVYGVNLNNHRITEKY